MENRMPASDLKLKDYRPTTKLVLPTTFVEKPRYPVIDAHNHLHLAGPLGGGWDKRPVSQVLDVLDEANVECFVDLDGGWGEDILQAHLDRFKEAAPDRFMHFGGVDWLKWRDHGDRFGEWAGDRLRVQARWGAQGLKIWKNLGLRVQDQHGALVTVDDPRLDPLWATAGELDLPVVIHIADPVAFFDPLDETNERWEELQAHPDWHFPSPPFPPFSTIVEALARVVERHPRTTFIGAHVGCYAENLTWVGALLDRAPNFYIDFSARIAELGRQPYSARRFFLQYADRILFGTDEGASVETYRQYYRFLESDDEYFDYSPDGSPTQGRWKICGLFLPDKVLEKIYWLNAWRVLFRK